MFELFLSKTPNKEASPATARQARHTTEKYSLLFSFCAPPISFSSNEKSIFLWCSAFQVFRQVAGLSAFCIRSGVAEFPPNPPSATPSLPTAIFLADFSYFSLSHPPNAEKTKELPFFFTISKYFGNIILWIRSLNI